MTFEDFLYRVGEGVEGVWKALKELINPRPAERPPGMRLTAKLTRKRVTVHELMSLHLQVVFLLYLAVNFAEVMLPHSRVTVPCTAVVYFTYLRRFLRRYGAFMLDYEAYRVFYYGVSAIAFAAFMGYAVMRRMRLGVYYYYAYVGAIAVAVLLFRWWFRERHGRDYAYGVVEDVKEDLARVFVHDDIAANVKPGLYWLPLTKGVESGRIVKVLVEERPLRSAVPVRILEVLEHQSSNTDTEPKDEIE
ncbi:MAG: DUF2101 domain-containing protein [Thermococci archaeon]|nr:DUF2101 domain-containing protein [Thermococci archaeon]